MTTYDKDEVLQYAKENDVRFVRLSFCDIFGQLKNVSISASELERAFSEGISFDASAIRGFLNIEDSDLLLFPDPETLQILPWRTCENGRVIRLFCDIMHPDLRPFEGDARYLLKEAENELYDTGYDAMIGLECEFYLFKNDEKGKPTYEPMDSAGYLDVAPLDKGENIRREISLTLEEMGIYIETSHHEKGPGQNEISFRPSALLSSADNLISFKNMVKTLASQRGLFASFLPKPLFKESGSGLHINISLHKEGLPFDAIKENMIAGMLSHIKELQLFLNPVSNSYQRLGSDEAPSSVTWGTSNRGLLIRVPDVKKESAKRIEIRLADPSCNPYLALLLLLKAAEDGIRRNMKLSDIEDGDQLAESLSEAADNAERSEFVRNVLPPHLLSCFLKAKRTDYEKSVRADNQIIYSRDLEFLVT